MLAYTGPSFLSSDGPPDQGFTTVMLSDGSGYLEYIGKAASYQDSFSWTRAAATLTNIVVLTNVGTVTTSTAHGLRIGNRVTVLGATVDADLNGTYVVASVPGTTSFTIATSGVSDATYTEATLVVETKAPRTTAAIWSIQRLFYTGAFNTRVAYAEGDSRPTKVFDSCTTYAYL